MADAERYRERVEEAEKKARDQESAKLAAESDSSKVGQLVACKRITKPAMPTFPCYYPQFSTNLSII